jgi:dipeptide/tripeptide permease
VFKQGFAPSPFRPRAFTVFDPRKKFWPAPVVSANQQAHIQNRMSTPSTTRNDRWPPQIKYIVGNEAAERFSYYGMKAILAIYITNVLMQTKDQATNIIHIFGFVNYFMPVLGAWVSDRLLGRYKTILWISLAYCVGHGVLALSDFIPTIDGKLLCLYSGLGLIAFGSGGIKPCVSAFMGDQFKTDQGHLMQKAYAAFYFSINFGSFFAFLAIPWIRKEWGYSWAFGVPGIFMAIATLVFWLGTRHYVMVPSARASKAAGFFKVFFFALRNRRAGESFWAPAAKRFSAQDVDAASSLGPILSIFALLPVFWALFDQTFSTWVLQGEKMKSCFISSVSTITPTDVKEPDAFVRVFLYGTNGASTRVTKTNSVVNTNLAALYVWSQFSPAGQGVIRDTNQPAKLRAETMATELNRLVVGPSFYETNRFATLSVSIDASLMLSAQLDPSKMPRLNRLLLEDVFRDELSKLYRIGPEEMLSANPLLVLIFVPVMTLWLYPRLGRLVTPLRRMSCGMFLSGVSFIVVAMLQSRIDAGEQLSVLWQFLPYIILTVAEVLVSTTGLEFAFSQAASTMKSTIMGFWYLAVAFGNLLVSFITKLLSGPNADDASVSTSRFMLYALMTFVVAVFFSLVAMRYRYRDATQPGS